MTTQFKSSLTRGAPTPVMFTISGSGGGSAEEDDELRDQPQAAKELLSADDRYPA